jgi:hypothetical protein
LFLAASAAWWAGSAMEVVPDLDELGRVLAVRKSLDVDHR